MSKIVNQNFLSSKLKQEAALPEQSFDTRCGHCNAVEHFQIGHDNSENDIEKALTHIQGKTRKQVRSILKKHTLNHTEYGFALYTCPKCQTLHNPFTIKIEYDDIMLFQPFYKCQQCNSTLIKATEPVTSYCCNHCGQKQLSGTPA